MLAERAKAVQESFEERQTSTEDALAALLKEIEKNEQRKKEQAAKGLDGLTYFVLCKLTDDGISNPEQVSRKVAGEFAKFPNWQRSEAELRELRKQVTFAVFAEEDDLEKVTATVEALFTLLQKSYRYRHLLYGPYQVYRRHRGFSILLLSGPMHSESAIYHEITSRQDLIANRGVIEAAIELYMDRKRRGPRQGSQQSHAAPGSIRRFVRVLQQLDVNYDVYGMSGKDIVSLLPGEFDVWLNRGQTTLRF